MICVGVAGKTFGKKNFDLIIGVMPLATRNSIIYCCQKTIFETEYLNLFAHVFVVIV